MSLFRHMLMSVKHEPPLDPNVVYTIIPNTQNCKAKAKDKTITSARISPKVQIDGQEYTCTEIYNSGFKNCKQLESIFIPNTIAQIYSDAFLSCTNLKKVNISDLNKWLQIFFWQATSNPIANAESLYLNNALLTDLVLPSGLYEVKQYAFRTCKSLTSLTIPKSLSIISNKAFQECMNLNTITYMGTISEWNAITKSQDWHNSVPATVVHCTDGDTPI